MHSGSVNTMTSRVARLFCTLVLLFRFEEVLSAPTTPTIMQFMKEDLSICKLPTFLYDTAVMKTCADIKYPKSDLELDYDNIEDFLCIGAYDAFYKLCQYSGHWQSSFNSTAAFDAYIKKLYPGTEATEKEQFCKNMKNITATSEKTKTLASQLTEPLNTRCPLLCSHMNKKIRTLCVLIAWINNTTESMKNSADSKVDVSKQTGKTLKDEITQSDNIKDDNKDTKETSVAKPLLKSQVDAKKEKVAEEKQTPANPMNSANAKDTEHQKNNVKPSSDAETENSSKLQTHDPILSKVHDSKTVKTEPEPNVNKINEESQTDDTEGKPDRGDMLETPDNSGIIKAETDSKVSGEDIKFSTISEHTQDSEYTPDPQVSYDPESDVDQPDTNDQNQNMPEPSEQREVIPQYHSIRPEEESHFFTYFTVISLVCIAGYIGYHNKQKVLAIVLEGRRSRNNRGRRRPSTASYRKLDCTLEEAVTSQCNANVTHVIY